jgi:hypothetical protein
MQERVKQGEQAAARMLLAIERAAEHPSYELLEAVTDARLSPTERGPVESHVAHCARCAQELAQMRDYAPQMAKKLKRRRASSRSPAAGVGGWFSGGPRLLVAMAVFIGALAVAGVWHATISTGNGANAVTPAMGGPSQTPRPGEFDRSVLDLTAQISTPALAAYKAGDYATLANLLAPLAERSNPSAQAVLGLLYAEGRGVGADARMAERLWLQAEGKVPAAKRNLQALRARESAAGGTR